MQVAQRQVPSKSDSRGPNILDVQDSPDHGQGANVNAEKSLRAAGGERPTHDAIICPKIRPLLLYGMLQFEFDERGTAPAATTEISFFPVA